MRVFVFFRGEDLLLVIVIVPTSLVVRYILTNTANTHHTNGGNRLRVLFEYREEWIQRGGQEVQDRDDPAPERVFIYLQTIYNLHVNPVQRSPRAEENEYKETKRKIFTNVKSSRNLISLSPNIDCCLLDIGFFRLALLLHFSDCFFLCFVCKLFVCLLRLSLNIFGIKFEIVSSMLHKTVCSLTNDRGKVLIKWSHCWV